MNKDELRKKIKGVKDILTGYDGFSTKIHKQGGEVEYSWKKVLELEMLLEFGRPVDKVNLAIRRDLHSRSMINLNKLKEEESLFKEKLADLLAEQQQELALSELDL